jgi:serine phosphatase RsbU (regulator of sigma subunit)/pSer/pThr/pTyr-binding forkhead associated (FHA) protein
MNLVILQGPNSGRRFAVGDDTTSIGRAADCDVCLESPAVSRLHAQVLRAGGHFYVEDRGSSNGTFLNGERIGRREPLTEDDALQIGPYYLGLRRETPPLTDPIVRSQVNALSSNQSLYATNAGYKLQVFVEIAQSLGRTLEVRPLLNKVLEQLFRLFPQADRGMVIQCEGDQYAVRAQRLRHNPAGLERLGQEGQGKPVTEGDFPFSRSLVKRALDEGVGLLSEDVGDDQNLPKTATLLALKLRSFLCVPLLGLDRRKLGVLQLDCTRPGAAFDHADLELLTALALQVAGVVENAALHEERLREERLRRDIALAREIQQSFLPQTPHGEAPGYELYARVHPAREVSGDLYDFFRQPDGRLALFLGDVSGKGMPAALFMIAVRTLARHLAAVETTPAQMLVALNNALVADNPTALFVTLAHALYDPASGEAVIVSGGHPPPLLRRANGRVEEVAVPSTMMLAYTSFSQPPVETRLTLQRGETLIFYTDGLTEAFTPDRTMFGVERLMGALGGNAATLPLADCAERVRQAVARFTGSTELQDDQTLLLLRRV